jgi:IS30 family transposase
MPKKAQKQLTLSERLHISLLKARNLSLSKIAENLGVDKSVISREIRRNSDKNGHYDPEKAHELAQKRKQKAASKPRKLKGDLLSLTQKKLEEGWSPEQISGFFKKNCLGEIGFSSIYRMVWADKLRSGKLYLYLRHKKPYMKRKKDGLKKTSIPGRVDIDEREPIVEEKSRIGDWEADLIVGANHQGYILTLVDRKSKFLIVKLLKTKTKEEAAKAIIEALIPYKDHVLTITFDNGGEWCGHQEISTVLCANTYFAKPYQSYQRGLNEHTNGLIREYYPKKTIFIDLLEKNIQDVARKINFRPRKITNFRIPAEVFFEGIY